MFDARGTDLGHGRQDGEGQPADVLLRQQTGTLSSDVPEHQTTKTHRDQEQEHSHECSDGGSHGHQDEKIGKSDHQSKDRPDGRPRDGLLRLSNVEDDRSEPPG